ncbi:MAG TPA: homoserine dehydrogenase [Anaerolineae bacterium]
MSTTVRVALVGLGNVGRAFLDLMESKAGWLADRYGLELVLTGAADSRGAVLDPKGINPAALRAHKSAGKGAGEFSGGRPGMPAPKMVAGVQADFLLEAATVNLRTGQPGLDCARTALRRGMGAVLADKGPLVHAFGELTALAAGRETPLPAGGGVPSALAVGPAPSRLAYSATVCGALPVVNIGRRDLLACEFVRVRGIFNSTSNFLLAAMTRGESYARALHQAQVDGVAETDPSLDVEGWDTANKLVIIANSILRQPATLGDVQPVSGITTLDPGEIRTRAAQGEIVKLIATAEWSGERYELKVEPEWLPAGDFLAQVSGWEMGIVFETDIMGVQQFKVDERGPIPTAAAMLRDLVNLAGG